MNNKYTQEELEQILLSKKLDEYYFAVIEHRDELLTEEEYDELLKRDKVINSDDQEGVEKLFNKIQTDKRFKNYASELMRAIYSFAQIRYVAILTMVDDEVYNIGEAKYFDLKRNKIIRYDNMTSFYDESNARVRYFTPEEVPGLSKKTLLMDVDDESIYQAYETKYVNQKENDDLSGEFIKEFRKKPNTLRRKQ